MASKWMDFFKANVVPKLIESGSFGKNVEFMEAVQDSVEGTLDQFASTVLFVNVEFRVDGSSKRFPFVCKFQHESIEVRYVLKTDLQFYNEIWFYKEIVPMLPTSVADLLPKFHFGQSTIDGSPEDMVVVQNLAPLGYRLTDEKVFLDFEHCCLAFKKLGEFHGGSIQLKSKQPEEFASKVGRLRETRWSGTRVTREELNYFYGENAKRGVIPLVQKGEHSDVMNRLLERLKDVQAIIQDILTVNSNSLLCHGDFCRNNIIFKYEEEKPVDVKFFDLATARYASPIIDISFFLFLNTSTDLRRKHFREDFLRVYLEGVQSVAPGVLSMDGLWQEFRAKAIYGYLLVAFFLPTMLNDLPDTLEHRLTNMTLKEMVETNLIRGGQKVTDILTETVRDLISWGCVQ